MTRTNPSKPILRAAPQTVRPTDIEAMDRHHRAQGFKACPGRVEDKAQSMPDKFGRPGPKRSKHPYAP